MSRERKIVISGFNIATHPHSPDGYVHLIRSIHSLKLLAAVRRTQMLMLGEIRPITTDGNMVDGIFGRFYKFDQIDPDAPWFNVNSLEIASEEDMAKVTIPSHLHPNLVTFDFVFFPRGHHLYFASEYEGHYLSPKFVELLLQKLLTSSRVDREFGDVELTMLPDSESLSKLLSLHKITKLKIDLVRPNPDDNSDDERRVLERLRKQGTRRIVEELTAAKHQSIKPDDETKTLAKVASRNGSVSVVGYTNSGDRVEGSTTQQPWREVVGYDPDEEIHNTVFVEACKKIHERT